MGGSSIGNITGGLVGESSAEKAEKEAKKQREQMERDQQEAAERQMKEDELRKQQESDLAAAAKIPAEKPQAKPTTTVDFTGSVKNQDEEDELLKFFRKGV